MRRHSESFPLMLVLATFVLAAFAKSFYEDAAKAWVLAKLNQWDFGAEASILVSGYVMPCLAIASLACSLRSHASPALARSFK
jgi:hypothetical protein